MGEGNIDNLIPLSQRTKEEQRRIATMGGKASGKARREKRIMSDLYAGLLQKKFKVVIDGKEEEVAGTDFLEKIVKKILTKADSSSVMMIKEIRQATEGQVVKIIEGSPLAEYTDEELEEMEKNLQNEIDGQQKKGT